MRLIHCLILQIVITASSSLAYRSKQCTRYRENDIFLNTCPKQAQGTVDFADSLFTYPSVISDLPKPKSIDITTQTKSNKANKYIIEEASTIISSAAMTLATSTNNIIDAISKTHSDESDDLQHYKEQLNQNPIIDNESTHIGKSNEKKTEDKEGNQKPIVSFEDWQKKAVKAEKEKDRRFKRKSGSVEEQRASGNGNKRQQMVDSIDGGFSDDFGSMFEDLIGDSGKEKTPNVYDEGEYIAPSKEGESTNKETMKDKKRQQAIRMKSLKERFNYASTDCAATVRKANKQAKGAHSILYESKDQYLLNKCSADKFVIINLCEQIVMDTIVMANFEFFSSTFKDFKVYASSKYPTNDWRLLGQWQARNTRDLQVFKVPDSGFVEYVKIEFLTHYGHEYYCPLSLIRIHGMSMMEYFTTVESQDEEPSEEEHLWPAEVREQIIQPQFEVTNTSESFPVKNDVDEDDIKPLIPPINFDSATVVSTAETIKDVNSGPTRTEDRVTESSTTSNGSNESSVVIDVTDDFTTIEEEVMPRMSDTTTHQETKMSVPTETPVPVTLSTLASAPSNFTEQHLITKSLSTPNTTEESSITTLTLTSALAEESIQAENQVVLSGDGLNESTGSGSSELPVLATNLVIEDKKSIIPPPPTIPQKIGSPNQHPKEGSSTQESIYKTIMKRLNVLEVNMTLSQRYLDDQNKILNDLFVDMERRHQDQLILLIGHLNETASHKIDSMKRRYEQWYEDLKDQTEGDMREMTAKVSFLADQLSFERRLSLTQLTVMVVFFVFMALSRGTFSALSPVMAAQQEERKRRESIDQSSTPSKNLLDAILNSHKNGIGSSNTSTDATITSSNTADSVDNKKRPASSVPSRRVIETPSSKKPSTPRRHSDSPYHTMGASEITTPIATRSRDTIITAANSNINGRADGSLQCVPTPFIKNMSRKTSYEKVRTETPNEVVLQRKLDDLLNKQRALMEEEPNQTALSINGSRKPSSDSLKQQIQEESVNNTSNGSNSSNNNTNNFDDNNSSNNSSSDAQKVS